MNRYLAVFAIAALLTGLGCNSATQRAGRQNLPSTNQAIRDAGDFKVIYDPVQDQGYSELRHSLTESKLFEVIVNDLNQVLALPVDIPIRFQECREATAFFDSAKKEIAICYELIGHFSRLFSSHLKSEEELEKSVLHATLFTFYHEMGHALIDVLRLQITGREEDSVDQLAILMLADSGEQGEEAALNGAVSFLLEAKNTDLEALPFWDEHSLDMQRFFNIICWVYGRNPRKFSHPVREGILPEERAERCGDEYLKFSKSWHSLLAPHLKK